MRNCRSWGAGAAVAGSLLGSLLPRVALSVAPEAAPAARPQPADIPLSRVYSLVPERDPYESIYEPPGPPRVEEGVNAGGVNFDLRVSYMTDYVYRGIDQSERLGAIDNLGNVNTRANLGAEDAPNLQFDGFLKLNLGRLPH